MIQPLGELGGDLALVQRRCHRIGGAELAAEFDQQRIAGVDAKTRHHAFEQRVGDLRVVAREQCMPRRGEAETRLRSSAGRRDGLR